MYHHFSNSLNNDSTNAPLPTHLNRLRQSEPWWVTCPVCGKMAKVTEEKDFKSGQRRMTIYCAACDHYNISNWGL